MLTLGGPQVYLAYMWDVRQVIKMEETRRAELRTLPMVCWNLQNGRGALA